MELADYNQAARQRADFAAVLMAEVKLGAITQEQALAQLGQAGFSGAELAKYELQIEQAKVLHGKLPSEAQLEKMLKANIIDAATWGETMLLLGYSQTWVSRLIQLVK